MQYTAAAALISLGALASATPFKFPLSNGFPTPATSQIPVIEHNAGGTLPNTPLPKTLGPNGVLDVQVIAVNEIFEVAFFTSLLKNVTNNVPGFECTGYNKTQVENILFEVRAQEELHALGANAILESAGHPAIQPCEYTFPSTSFDEAIALADTFTSLVLGTLQTVQVDLATEGGDETDVVQLVGSIIGQEGEQTGFYRFLESKNPSASPFLTVGGGVFAFNAISQLFIVPGSCPNLPSLPALSALSVLAQPPAQNSTVSFTTSAAATTSQFITYLSGQNSPVSVPVTSVTSKDGKNVVSASFPFEGGFSKGLTVATLTKTKGPFANSSAVASDGIAGPGLIQVE